MNRFPTDFDKECADGLSAAELSELVIGYAQENERLEEHIKRLTSHNAILFDECKRLEAERIKLFFALCRFPHKTSCETYDGGVRVKVSWPVSDHGQD